MGFNILAEQTTNHEPLKCYAAVRSRLKQPLVIDRARSAGQNPPHFLYDRRGRRRLGKQKHDPFFRDNFMGLIS